MQREASQKPLIRLPLRTFFLLLLAALPLFLYAVWLYVGYAQRTLAAEMTNTAHERLALYSGTLHSALNKYAYLPHILATHPSIQRLVTSKDNTDAANRYLEDINDASGSMALFVLNREGATVAASNWNTPESFFGHDYHYRPYYQDAMRDGRGGYFGVGATTGKPGFFFTEKIRQGDQNLGVAVAKVDLAMLQRQWRDGGETVFITDRHGVIFLSSRDDWRYRATKELEPAASAAMLEQRQYGSTLPSPIATRAFRLDGADMLEIDGQTWLYTTRPLNEYGWTLWFLTPVSALKQQIEPLWYMGLGAACMAVLFILLARVLLAWAKAKRAAGEARKIQAVNRRLAAEVRIRKKTEQELLAAQDSLLHAGRMAALGQLAASVAHELSQPVTSMGMFAASCRRMAQEGRHDKVEETVGHILSLVKRITSLIGQLKHFSRKSPVCVMPVSLRDALNNALTVLHGKQESSGCVPRVTFSSDAVVMGDALQLEQVLINLVQNALDAVNMMPGAPEDKRVEISLEIAPGNAFLSVEDNGPGIEPEARDNLFTPFFTTKKSGDGIGLGLAIADNIACSMQGDITAQNIAPHGARFTLRLPLAPDG